MPEKRMLVCMCVPNAKSLMSLFAILLLYYYFVIVSNLLLHMCRERTNVGKFFEKNIYFCINMQNNWNGECILIRE